MRSIVLYTGTILFTGTLFAAIVVADARMMGLALLADIIWALVWIGDD